MKALLFSTILFVPMLAFASLPDFPMAFWGIATLDGVAAPAGSIVRVYDGQTEVGESVVQSNGAYGYTEPTKQKLVVGEGEGVLTFTIQESSVNGGVETQGISVVTYPSFVSGETVNKDLSFTTKTAVISSGGSSGGGGGGSSSKKKTKTPTTELVLGVATSTLSEEEYKLGLQKQIIILLTQLISLLQMKLAL